MDGQVKQGIWNSILAAVNFSETKKKVDNLDNRMSELEKDIVVFKEFKVQTQKFIDSKIFSAKSPLSLTDFGVKLVEESGLEKILKDKTVKKDLLQMLEEKQPQTRYDVQEMARELMNGLTEYKPFAPIKDYAYDQGKDFQQILRAGGILLRDTYIEKNMSRGKKVVSRR
ncbi:MAG: hypothetical protein OYG31_01085 [Candidatus Kaiserbacteria bacterium]|nr:hypothetical protein [Candidatus Kaiserbacteria bacterium]